MTQQEMQLEYFKACLCEIRPQCVPKRVHVLKTVRSDILWSIPGPHPWIVPGEYDVTCNRWGAVTVMTPDGPLGLKPDEFAIVEMQEALA